MMGTGCLLQTGIGLTCLHNFVDKKTNRLLPSDSFRVYVGLAGKKDPEK
jgi:hypothetical protein